MGAYRAGPVMADPHRPCWGLRDFSPLLPPIPQLADAGVPPAVPPVIRVIHCMVSSKLFEPNEGLLFQGFDDVQAGDFGDQAGVVRLIEQYFKRFAAGFR